MNAKIILGAMTLSLALAALQPVLAGPKVNPTNQQIETEKPVGISPIRGDLHVYLRSF